ncbi:MAG: PEP-CTERM sorting domain-containing protein [Verrucomicrobiota bacterium]
MNPFKRVAALSFCLGVTFLTFTSRAGNVWWVNSGAGNWDVGANWNNTNTPGLIPTAADAAFINNGGTALIDSSMTIAAQFVILAATNGNTGFLNMSGGSLTTSSDIRIGNSIAITGGTSGGTGIINQSGGSVLLNGGNLNVGLGDSAIGTYNLSAGSVSLATASGGIIAVGNRGSGTVNQTGGSIYARNAAGNSQVNLGRNGVVGASNPGKASGQYTLSGGDLTVVSLRYGNAVGAATGSVNTFNLQGTGSLTVSNISIINTAAANTFNFSGGTLTATSSGMSLANNGGKLSPATLAFGGSGVAPNTAAEVVTSPVGTMTFLSGSSYSQGASGTLVIDLTPTGNDFVSIGAANSAIIAGTISLNLASNYDPAPGSTFDILTAGLINNTATINGGTPSGYGFDSSIIAGGTGGQLLRLTVVPEPGTYALFGLSGLAFLSRSLRTRKNALR